MSERWRLFCASPGYEGATCESDIDECAEQPCEHGQCFQRSDPSYWEPGWEVTFADLAGYLCQCHPGFAGQWPAAKQLMEGSGVTFGLSLTGENCSVNIDECESEPCQNGATCEDGTNAYACLCSAGFQGEASRPSWSGVPGMSFSVQGNICYPDEAVLFVLDVFLLTRVSSCR